MNNMFDLVQAVLEEMRILKKEVRTTNQTPADEVKETWVSTIEVQRSLGVCEKTLYRLRCCGALPYSRIRGKIYYKMSDVKSLLEKNYRCDKPKCCGCK
jgi:hypothetical protein